MRDQGRVGEHRVAAVDFDEPSDTESLGALGFAAMTYARKRTVLRTCFEDTPTSSACSVSARVSPLTEASDMDFGSNAPTLPPGKKVKKRFVLQALAKTESMMPAHPWNLGYRTWKTWGKRFYLRKSAEQALNSARNQHGKELHFRVVESSR